MNTKTFSRTAVAAALLVSSFASQAAPSMGDRVVTGVGQWIAAQGNQALREIHDDLRQQIGDSLQPMLPEISPQQEGNGAN